MPEGVSASFSSFLEQRLSVKNHRYGYLRLAGREFAKPGNGSPISGVILLDRREEAKAVLKQEGMEPVVKELILRNFARNNKAIEIVDRIREIVACADCFRLIYSDLSEGASALIDYFGPVSTQRVKE